MLVSASDDCTVRVWGPLSKVRQGKPPSEVPCMPPPHAPHPPPPTLPRLPPNVDKVCDKSSCLYPAVGHAYFVACRNSSYCTFMPKMQYVNTCTLQANGVVMQGHMYTQRCTCMYTCMQKHTHCLDSCVYPHYTLHTHTHTHTHTRAQEHVNTVNSHKNWFVHCFRWQRVRPEHTSMTSVASLTSPSSSQPASSSSSSSSTLLHPLAYLTHTHTHAPIATAPSGISRGAACNQRWTRSLSPPTCQWNQELESGHQQEQWGKDLIILTAVVQKAKRVN